jgi:ferredoxin-NADP reductase
MLCGTNAFLHDMRAQFRALGLPDARIIAEEFQLR